MSKFRTLLLALLTGISAATLAQEPLVFSSPEEEARFLALTTELRCLVCQNQTIADSDAPLAHDLRQEIFDMMATGATDGEIKEFMVARYGDFVLYRPPVQSNTIILWAGPFLLFLIGGIVVARAVKKRSARLEESGEEEA